MWLRIRSLTLRLISGLPSLNHSVGPKNSEKTTENGVSSRIDILRLLLQQLEVALETGKRFIEKEIQVSSVCVYHHMTPPLSFFFGFLGLHLWHVEVPRLGVELDIQLAQP